MRQNHNIATDKKLDVHTAAATCADSRGSNYCSHAALPRHSTLPQSPSRHRLAGTMVFRMELQKHHTFKSSEHCVDSRHLRPHTSRNTPPCLHPASATALCRHTQICAFLEMSPTSHHFFCFQVDLCAFYRTRTLRADAQPLPHGAHHHPRPSHRLAAHTWRH